MSETQNGGTLAEDLRTLVDDTEELLRATGNAAGSAHLKARAEETLADLRARLNSVEDQLRARARDVDSYVRDNPWQAVAIAGGAALLLGLIMGRR
jgi:ElaB/YqjD/DUF883 family membrane-anchored ribosome-binding protein